jgi:hypothetical protein
VILNMRQGRSFRARGLAFVAALATSLAVVVPLVLNSGADPAGGAITTPPFQLSNAGSLTLTTTTGTTNNVVRRDAANNVVATQAISATGSCALSTNPTLLAFTTTKGSPGLNKGTIGDKTGGSGTDCGLVEAGGSLSMALGSQVSNLEMRSFALDVETRKNLKLVLTASLDGSPTSTYELRTGASVVAGQGSTTPGSSIFNCNAGSSSDPNAADRDNCRFSGNVLADKLELKVLVGEVGLSGGASGGVTTPSQIQLTDVDGFLDCESQPNDGDFDLTEGGNTTPEVGIVRKENLDPNEPCELIPVDLNTSVQAGKPQVQFLKDLTGQTSAAFTMDVTWPSEAAQNPPPPTQFEFVDGQPVELKLCVGTPVYNSTTGVFDGIGELLDTNTANDSVVPDLVSSLPGKQYSCYYHQETDLVAKDRVKLNQQIYIIGDYKSYR